MKVYLTVGLRTSAQRTTDEVITVRVKLITLILIDLSDVLFCLINISTMVSFQAIPAGA